MPAEKTCSYCGDDITPGTGLMYVKRDGTILYLCSSKCEKNMKLGRRAEELEWTEKSLES
ncbi:MAG: 50S ribosomal protein L24e [Candidatus Hadarchaeia archaeon]